MHLRCCPPSVLDVEGVDRTMGSSSALGKHRVAGAWGQGRAEVGPDAGSDSLRLTGQLL